MDKTSENFSAYLKPQGTTQSKFSAQKTQQTSVSVEQKLNLLFNQEKPKAKTEAESSISGALQSMNAPSTKLQLFKPIIDFEEEKQEAPRQATVPSIDSEEDLLAGLRSKAVSSP